VQKKSKERKECEEKEKKRKDARGDQHMKSCRSQILKSRSRFIVQRFCSETCRDYRKL
jgi:hypothetical protein